MKKLSPVLLALSFACATPQKKVEQEPQLDPRFVARQHALAQIEANFERVHFEFDSALLTKDTADALALNVTLMNLFPEIHLEVQGHCDALGTSEYNLALGQRRAEVIKRYMVVAGVNVARVTTISYGEEVPLNEKNERAANARNRRAEFKLTVRSPMSKIRGTVAQEGPRPVSTLARGW